MKKNLSIVIILTAFILGSCNKQLSKDFNGSTDKTLSTPTLTTFLVCLITDTTATCGGNITSDGGAYIIARGVCWNTSQYPTTANNKTDDGNGIGNFSSSITGLTQDSKYYIRAYATNSVGTSYGNEQSFNTEKGVQTVNDIDGNVYHIVTFGLQTWMVENLKTSRYCNGTPIPNVTNNKSWGILTNGAYCNYENIESNAATYGRLYNWYAVNTGKLAPVGWHVPTDADWTILENYLIANGYNYDGTKDENKFAKSLATTTGRALSPETGTQGACPVGNNSTGFAGLPGGSRGSNGTFRHVGENGDWWSSTASGTDGAYGRYLGYSGHDLSLSHKECGFSVRCVKD